MPNLPTADAVDLWHNYGNGRKSTTPLYTLRQNGNYTPQRFYYQVGGVMTNPKPNMPCEICHGKMPSGKFANMLYLPANAPSPAKSSDWLSICSQCHEGTLKCRAIENGVPFSTYGIGAL